MPFWALFMFTNLEKNLVYNRRIKFLWEKLIEIEKTPNACVRIELNKTKSKEGVFMVTNIRHFCENGNLMTNCRGKERICDRAGTLSVGSKAERTGNENFI